MLDLSKKEEVNLGNGITVKVAVLPMIKMKELTPVTIALSKVEGELTDEVINLSVDAIHTILEYSGNSITKEVIRPILTLPMLKGILEIAYGQRT
jgi:hypothetical protein